MSDEAPSIPSAPIETGRELAAGDLRRTLEFDGRKRTYLVHVPPGHDASKPAPVVLVLHGGRTNARTMARFCGLNETADRGGFLAVYPSGTGRNPNLLAWNAGNCCGDAAREKVDDVGFIRRLLDEMAQRDEIDVDRVFVTGMSNGGMMAYRLASELADRIAAIASIAGPMAIEACQPMRPVSILHFHGTADEYTPYGGGRGPRSSSQIDFRSVDSTIARWIAANGCPPEATESIVSGAPDGLRVEVRRWGPGEAGSEVVLYKIDGGGHTWPGRIPLAPVLGPATTAISANEILWDFFQRHARRRHPSRLS